MRLRVLDLHNSRRGSRHASRCRHSSVKTACNRQLPACPRNEQTSVGGLNHIGWPTSDVCAKTQSADSSGPMHVRYRSVPVTVCLKIGPSNVAGAPCTDTVYRRLGSCFHQNSDAAFPTGPWSSGSYQTPKSNTQSRSFGRLHRGAPSMLAPWAWRCYQRLLLGLSDPRRC